MLELNQNQMPCVLTIQVWNENDGYFESDDIIGCADVTLHLGQLQTTGEELQEGTPFFGCLVILRCLVRYYCPP
jgi:hypothetical protein